MAKDIYYFDVSYYDEDGTEKHDYGFLAASSGSAAYAILAFCYEANFIGAYIGEAGHDIVIIKEGFVEEYEDDND